MQIAQCTRQAVPFLSKNVASTPFLAFYLDSVVPVVDAVASPDARLELLRGMAELAPESAVLADPDAKLHLILKALMVPLLL